MPDFPHFCLLACIPLTLPIFSGVLFLLLFCVIFLSYIVIYLLRSMGKKKTDLASLPVSERLSFGGYLLIGCLSPSSGGMPVLVSLFLLYAATSCSFGVKHRDGWTLKGRWHRGK